MNEQNDETDGGEQVAGLCEGEAVTESVGEVGCCKGPDGGGEEDGDDEDLDVARGGVGVECLDEGGAEEVDGVGCCAGADVDWDAGVCSGIGWFVFTGWTDGWMDGRNRMDRWIDLPEPNLPILKTAFDGLCIKSVHPCLACTFEDACF